MISSDNNTGIMDYISSFLVGAKASVKERVERRIATWQRRRIDQVVFFACVALAVTSIVLYRQNVQLKTDVEVLKSDVQAIKVSAESSVAELKLEQRKLGEKLLLTVKPEDVGKMFGLISLNVIRTARDSFLELYSYDDRGASSYGTAGYLGNGYFITVKHGVVALGQEGLEDPRKITSIRISYNKKLLEAELVDTGDAKVEVDPGDWAIVRVKSPIEGVPPLRLDLSFPFNFADPVFRLGNDYSKGILASTGYIGVRTDKDLVTCLTDGHPGVSGGGVLNPYGDLVGIPVGRMQGDYRFSFILPIRAEMFRKVPLS